MALTAFLSPKTLVAATLSLLLLAPTPSQAQLTLPSDTKLGDVLFTLYLEEIASNINVIAALLGVPPADIQSLFEQDLADALVITQAISNQASSFPLGSSAGGFSWTFDPSAGTFTRETASFGPLFAERAVTVGRNKLNVGVNYQRATYDEFEGLSLQDRDIKFFTPFPTGLLVGEDALSAKIATDTVGLFANYGVTNNFDVGVAVPIVHVDLDANLRFRFLNTNGQQAGTFEYTTAGGGSATGVGDVVVRTKYNLWRQAGGGVAVGLDVRLPTGDEENLLGIPGTQAKLFGIVSTAVGKLSPHVNVGYTFSKANDKVGSASSEVIFLDPPDELNYAGGADFAVTPRLTVVGDLIGRTLRDMPRLAVVTLDIGPSFQEFDIRETASNVNLLLGAVGAKWNVFGNLLASGHLIFPVKKTGLRDKQTFVLGLDYSF